jgi:hypothetical protein
MTLRRIAFAMAILGGLCVWGFAQSADGPNPSVEPTLVEDAEGRGTHDAAEARYRHSQSTHWRHVAVGNTTYCR